MALRTTSRRADPPSLSTPRRPSAVSAAWNRYFAMRATHGSIRRDLTLGAFTGLFVLVGANPVAIRYSNAEFGGTGAREPLRAGRSVLNLLGLAQGIHRFVDGQEDCRFQRAKRTAATDRQRNRGHGHVVGGLP